MIIFSEIILPFLLAFVITVMLIPNWIRVCDKWDLFERIDDRKKHKINVPTAGGFAIFAGIIISFLLLGDDTSLHHDRYLIASSLILFFTGYFDDLLDLPAGPKFALQLLAAAIIAIGGTRITNLFGIFGVNEIPVWLQYPITILFITGITNAYNLVDGLDGLAGSLGLMASIVFGILFYQYNETGYAILSFCVAGSLIGFLLFNFHPAKIFMGDTGSLIIGFILSVMAITLLDMNFVEGAKQIVINPLIVAAVLFVPVYDVFRVSVIRLLTGYSPFRPDRNHVHHMIMGQGFGQRVTNLLIVFINLVFVALAILFEGLNINLFLLMSVCVGMITINSLMMSKLASLYGKLGGRVYGKSVQA